MEQWQTILKQNFRSHKALAHFLRLSEENAHLLTQNTKFPLNLPVRLAEKIPKNDPMHPLFLQFVPLSSSAQPDFLLDPVQDTTFKKFPKLLHKYETRALLLVSGACAMHCRYCFRQNFPYEKEIKGFQEELKYIRDTPTLHEVILSGGDPLSLSDRALRDLIDELEAIEHIKVIRFHTRFILGIPERITPHFLSILSNRRVQFIFMAHINHPDEMDSDIYNSIKAIQTLGVPVLCQTVLLKGVNDEADTLYRLYMELISNGVIPYYLFELDKVKGAERFLVERESALSIMHELQERLPGYALPRYAVEIPGKKSKTILY